MKNKGAAIILVAGITLCFLLLFAVLAIDFSRMYYVRGELQNAADTAALAGADKLTGATDSSTDSFKQELARQEAWKFACKNRAAQAPVYLSTNDSINCDVPPSYSLLNGTTNADTGDIIVGNWDQSKNPKFTRANGSTGLSINAVRVVARRTTDSPGGSVTLLFGKLISGLTNMGVVREAIASLTPLQIVPFPVCIPSCSLNTPLKVEWGYDDSQPKKDYPEVNPILCSDPYLPEGNGNSNTDDAFTPSSTPGQQFFLSPSSQSDLVPRPGMAWTNFDIEDCNVHPACKHGKPTKDKVLPYITGEKQAPNVCNQYICTTNGTIKPLLETLKEQLDKNMSTYNLNGQNIKGWLVTVPIVSDDSCGDPMHTPKQSCPGDQGGMANPYLVTKFAKVVITDVVTEGHKGIRIVSLNNPRQETFTFKCKEGGNLNTKTITRWVSQLDCVDCNTPPGGTHAQLVK